MQQQPMLPTQRYYNDSAIAYSNGGGYRRQVKPFAASMPIYRGSGGRGVGPSINGGGSYRGIVVGDGEGIKSQGGGAATLAVDADVEFSKLAYGKIVAELLGADVSVDRLVKFLQSHDATFEQVLSKMRKLRDTVRKRRPAAVPFFKLGYYVGLHVRDVDYGSNGDGTIHVIASGPLDDVASAIITAGVAGNAANGNSSSKPTLPIATVSYNDSPLDAVTTTLVSSTAQLDQYCAALTGMLDGQESRERLAADDELNHVSSLIRQKLAAPGKTQSAVCVEQPTVGSKRKRQDDDGGGDSDDYEELARLATQIKKQQRNGGGGSGDGNGK